jgi:hypothetical protein
VLLTRPLPPPIINGFTVQPPQAAAGQLLQAAWDASGAASFTLSLNGMVVQTLDGNAESASLTTEGLLGAVRVGLVAENSGGEASAEATAVVTAPLAIAAFNSNPDALVRNVVLPVTFAWSAPGAVSVRLLGTEALSASPVTEALPPEGTITLTAYVLSPESELLVTLIAEDASGQRIQQSLALPVSDPLCTAIGDTNLTDLPFVSGQVISTVPAGTPVVVDARNSDSTWLRVRLGGVRGWGEATAFSCGESFDLSALQPDPTVPQASPTPVAPAVPAATSAPAGPTVPTPGVTSQPGTTSTTTGASPQG